MKTGKNIFTLDVFNHLYELRMQQRFSTVSQVDIENEIFGFIQYFFIQREFHESMIFFFKVLVGAHDAIVIADACEFHPEPHRQVGKRA